MSIQRHDVKPRLSQAVVYNGVAYLAGVVPKAAAGKSMREQTAEVLSTIDQYLAMAGTDKSKLLSTLIYITDMSEFGEMNEAWEKWVVPGQTPARATVEVSALAKPEFHVEIVVTAAV